MRKEETPDLSLFIDILRTLETIGAPYMIIGAFAAAMYGTTRTTYDIDIVVDLSEEHIRLLAAAYPSPRYSADPLQMRDSIRLGIMFNIIDSSRGEKADLIPLTMATGHRRAFRRRVRHTLQYPGCAPFDAWYARAEDVIIGKLEAWQEGRSRKHETDIYQMLVFYYMKADPQQAAAWDDAYLEGQVRTMGADVIEFWQRVKEAAHKEAKRVSQ